MQLRDRRQRRRHPPSLPEGVQPGADVVVEVPGHAAQKVTGLESGEKMTKKCIIDCFVYSQQKSQRYQLVGVGGGVHVR